MMMRDEIFKIERET